MFVHRNFPSTGELVVVSVGMVGIFRRNGNVMSYS